MNRLEVEPSISNMSVETRIDADQMVAEGCMVELSLPDRSARREYG